MMALGATIRIFLVDGTPDGLKLVEKSNWTGVGLVCNRSQYASVRGRPEFDRPGVYMLTGPPEAESTKSRLYIGEADAAKARIDDHLRKKDFWTRLVLFTSKDMNLNKAHVRYLESRLIELAGKAKTFELQNSNATQIPQLSEPEVADAEGFLAEMLVLLPLLEIDAFEPPTRTVGATEYVLTSRGANARGSESGDGFVVYAGSEARQSTTASIHGYLKQLRDDLVTSGVLEAKDDRYVFVQDWTFGSPSTAAGVLMGAAANGRTEWKTPTGRTLKELQEASVPAGQD